MLSKYQLMIADYYKVWNIKKLLTNFFDKGKYVLHYKNFATLFKTGIILKKYTVYYHSINHNG